MAVSNHAHENGLNSDRMTLQNLPRLKQELTAICRVLGKTNEQKSLVEVLQDIGKMAFSDELCQMPNRNYLKFYLAESIARARIQKESLSLVLMNIDNFKLINETYGKIGGDVVIEQIARVLGGKVRSVQSLIREKDLYSRYNGDEFAIVLPGANSQIAVRVIERIKSSMQNYIFTFKGIAIDKKITASFGIAGFNPEKDSYYLLLEKAQSALFKAKKNGKNCIVIEEE